MNSSHSITTSTQSLSPRQRRGSAFLDNERWLGPLLIGPAVLYIVLLVGLPFLMALYYSVSNTTTGGGTTASAFDRGGLGEALVAGETARAARRGDGEDLRVGMRVLHETV